MGRSVPDRPPGGCRVVPGERHGRTVVVQLAQIDIEGLHGTHHDIRQQGGAVRQEQGIEGAAHAIVIEKARRALGQPQEGLIEPAGPLVQRVEGFAFDQDVAQQHPDPEGGSQPQALIVAWHKSLEAAVKLEPLENTVDDRQRADDLGEKRHVLR